MKRKEKNMKSSINSLEPSRNKRKFQDSENSDYSDINDVEVNSLTLPNKKLKTNVHNKNNDKNSSSSVNGKSVKKECKSKKFKKSYADSQIVYDQNIKKKAKNQIVMNLNEGVKSHSLNVQQDKTDLSAQSKNQKSKPIKENLEKPKKKKSPPKLIPLSNDEIDDEKTVESFSAESLNSDNNFNSKVDGKEAFKFIINPMKTEKFFSQHWEKKPLLLKRENSSYYKNLFSTSDFDKMLIEHNVQYSKNLDVTSYSNGERETHNPIGRALGPVVWDYYNNGCSLRLLNPQTFNRPVWRLLSSLQEHIGSFCGANVYLTPPGTQGFAPHWDDIEAFILQLEGKKHWRVYSPRNSEETLPRESSANLSQEEVGDPIIDTVLEAGDLLYFPRGYIHQGNALEDEHSLHITVSMYQKTSWIDLFEKVMPQALQVAAKEDIEFRKGLPLNYLQDLGVVNMEKDTKLRNSFLSKFTELLTKLVEYAPIDAAVDQMGKSFIHDCLPPVLSQQDKICTALDGGNRWSKKKKRVFNRTELGPEDHVRLIRGNCIRLLVEDEEIRIYHSLENSREYHQEEPQYLELAVEHGPGVEALIRAYPNYIAIENLPLETLEEKVSFIFNFNVFCFIISSFLYLLVFLVIGEFTQHQSHL